ncbi:hypothetical protein AB7W30_17440 [Providencia manganoxydans]
MEFKELPENIQLIAATTLAEILKNSCISKEIAEGDAERVKAAFIKLYKD